MCGIFAYANFGTPRNRSAILSVLLHGLRRLEYRGYDSAGLACDGESVLQPLIIREAGAISRLEESVAECATNLAADVLLENHVGIAHTRWATHGRPSRCNSHPQRSDPANTFLIVHNGIITNHGVLRDMLERHGVRFESQTDTETIAKLTKFLYDELTATDDVELTFPRLVMAVMQRLEGAFAVIFRSTCYPNELVACRRGSPLVLGTKPRDDAGWREQLLVKMVRRSPPQRAPSPAAKARSAVTSRQANGRSPDSKVEVTTLINGGTNAGEDGAVQGEFFISSDASAIVEHTDRVFYLEDDDVVHTHDGRLDVYNLTSDASSELTQNRSMVTLSTQIHQLMKGEFDHIMQKEIHEQPDTLMQTMRGRIKLSADEKTYEINLGGVRERLEHIVQSNRLIFIACGSSYHACLAARQVMEELTEIPVHVELASDFNDRQCPLFRSDVCVFVSQSGETRDTLDSLQYARSKDAVTVGVVNVVGSEISRLTDCGLHLNAGCEIGVASTKVYTSQIIALIMFALQLSIDSMRLSARRQQVFRALVALPEQVRTALSALDAPVRALAHRLQHDKSILLFGRGYQYATCLEGALKVKEVSYMHTEGIHAGELKHGPLALVDEKMPVVVVCGVDATRAQVHNALQQVLARRASGASFVLICAEDDDETSRLVDGRGEVLRVPPSVDCLQGVLNVLPLQLLSYHLAVARQLNVDRPRHLAKSVTV